MTSSTIQVESFERIPGIYIIFNKDTYHAYIGQANDLKRRAFDHVRDLYAGKDNSNLQEAFDKGSQTYRIGFLKTVPSEELDKWECIFILAAVKRFGRDCVYNINHLQNKTADDTLINEACKIIEDGINRKNITENTRTFKSGNVHPIQDWIGKTNLEIVENAVVPNLKGVVAPCDTPVFTQY